MASVAGANCHTHTSEVINKVLSSSGQYTHGERQQENCCDELVTVFAKITRQSHFYIFDIYVIQMEPKVL